MSDETASHPQIKISWLFGIAVGLALFAVIGNYSARMTWNTPDYDQERAADRYATLAKVKADESKLLNPVDENGKPTAIWVDQGKGIISIPIAEAMTKVVDDLKAKTPGPATEINPAPAAPAPAPSAPATNAAPAAPAAPAPGGKPTVPSTGKAGSSPSHAAEPSAAGPAAAPAKPKT